MIFSIRRVRVCCAVLAGLAMAGASAMAQETVHFRQQLKAGDVIDFSQQSDMQMSFDVRSNGQVLQQIEQKMTNTRSGRQEILEVDAGKPVKVRVAFAPTSGGSMEAMGQRQAIPFGAAGQTVTVSRQNGMTVIDHDGDLDEQTQQELMGLLEQEDSFFPDRPLKVGETFDADPETLKRAFEMGDGKATARGTVLAVREVGGRRQAQVRLEADLNGTVQGVMQVGLKLQGDIWFDEQTSRPVDATIKGPMTISGQVSEPMQPGGPPVPMQIAGGGQVIYAEKGAFNGDGNGPIVGQANGAGVPAGEGKQGIPGFGRGPDVVVDGGQRDDGGQADDGRRDIDERNPFETAIPANPIAGKYSGEGMELDVQPDGSGTIKMGNTSARIVGLNLDETGSGNGRFQVDNGAAFDFTIERNDADTLVFKTGRSTYKLQRAAQPAPPNPFDQ